MQSGQTGINAPRIYNPVKQSIDQDKDGVFVRRWVPELSALPAAFLHEPWRMTAEDERNAGVILGVTYPRRIIDHEEAARAARARLSEVRRQPGFGKGAQAVYVRHGSRKRTMKDDNPARTRAIKALKSREAAAQLTLKI